MAQNSKQMTHKWPNMSANDKLLPKFAQFFLQIAQIGLLMVQAGLQMAQAGL